MIEFILAAVVGVMCIFIGIMNRRGNVSMLHSYHRNRVSEEDRIPFGKKVGLGMIVIGGSIIVSSALFAVTLLTGAALFELIGMAVLIAGIICGCAVAFYAMKKYNKGIF